MDEAPPWKRTIVYHGSDEALGQNTALILGRLGYRMIASEGFLELRAQEPSFRPDMLLVDERRMPEAAVAHEDIVEDGVPIVLLTGKLGATGDDARIVGAVKRPAGLHDLYRLMQQVFEDTPRSTPRVATQLEAKCGRGDRSWDGRVLSLSENGCLIRSREEISLGQHISLEFTLPESGSLRLEAEAAYQLLPDLGLVFSAVDPCDRKTLEGFVMQSILAA